MASPGQKRLSVTAPDRGPKGSGQAGGSCGQRPRCPQRMPSHPLSFHLSHFRYPPPPPARIQVSANPLMAEFGPSPGPFFHEPKALHSLKKEAGLNLLPMLQGGEGVAISKAIPPRGWSECLNPISLGGAWPSVAMEMGGSYP